MNGRIRGKDFVEIIFAEAISKRFVDGIKVKLSIRNLSIYNTYFNMHRCRINYVRISILILYLHIYNNYKNKNLISIDLACKLIDIN